MSPELLLLENERWRAARAERVLVDDEQRGPFRVLGGVPHLLDDRPSSHPPARQGGGIPRIRRALPQAAPEA